MTAMNDEQMRRELAARERVQDVLARVDRTLAEPRPAPESLWQVPPKPTPPARVVEPARSAAVPAVRAPMPPAKQGSKVWAQVALGPGEEPTWQWLSIPHDDGTILEAVCHAFRDFTRAARDETDRLESGRNYLLIRAKAAEERADALEARIAALEAKR